MKSQSFQTTSFKTSSEEETIALGRRLGPGLPNGAVLLIGNLGAGKTTLASGIVEGRGVATMDDVTSPTFTLIHQYGNEEEVVYHVDLYRLDEPAEVESLGLEDLFSSGALVLLEWAERFPALLPVPRVEITLSTGSGPGEEDLRWISVSRIEKTRTEVT